MKQVLIGGGSGLIGKRLSQLLKKRGYAVSHLSRSVNGSETYPTFHWDTDSGQIDEKAVAEADVIINLAGAGIADARWTQKRKQLIIDSRVQTTRLLYKTWQKLQSPPEAFVSAAAMGYYGDRGDDWMYETNMPGGGFLPVSCIAWEKAIKEAAETAVRTVWLRTGIVLSQEGGALPKMVQPQGFGLNPYFGDGRQWYSWLHLEDMCRMYMHAIENTRMQGAYNAASPHPERNKNFVTILAEAAGRNVLKLPAPTFALRLALGEMADTILSSTRMNVDKLSETGFEWMYPQLKDAASNLLNSPKA